MSDEVEEMSEESSLDEEFHIIGQMSNSLQGIKNDIDDYVYSGSKKFKNVGSAYLYTNKHLMNVYFKFGSFVEIFNNFIELKTESNNSISSMSLGKENKKRTVGFETSSLIEKEEKE